MKTRQLSKISQQIKTENKTIKQNQLTNKD